MPELLIGENWREASDRRTRNIHSLADQRPVTTVFGATAGDAADAVITGLRGLIAGGTPPAPRV